MRKKTSTVDFCLRCKAIWPLKDNIHRHPKKIKRSNGYDKPDSHFDDIQICLMLQIFEFFVVSSMRNSFDFISRFKTTLNVFLLSTMKSFTSFFQNCSAWLSTLMLIQPIFCWLYAGLEWARLCVPNVLEIGDCASLRIFDEVDCLKKFDLLTITTLFCWLLSSLNKKRPPVWSQKSSMSCACQPSFHWRGFGHRIIS